MSLTYLNQTKSAVFDASGTATVVLRPDVGQWWQCSLIRVSTGSQTPPLSYAAVYHGSQAAVGPTTFIDDTFQANSDSSTIISGVVVQFGDAVIVKFQNGTAGDVAIATLYGQSSDRPDEFQLLSPGTHFVGHAPTGITSVVLFQKTVAQVAVPTTFNLGFVGNSPNLGIGFQSLSNAAQVDIEYFADSAYSVFLSGFSFAIDILTAATFYNSVPVGGPFCQITITPSSNFIYNGRVWVSPVEFVGAQSVPAWNFLISEKARSVGAGVNFTWDSDTVYAGEAHFNFHTTAAVYTIEMYGVDYNGTLNFIFFRENGGANYNETLLLPGLPIRVIFHNGDAASKFVDLSLIAHPWTPGR